jgi:hypothetical protein
MIVAGQKRKRLRKNVGRNRKTGRINGRGEQKRKNKVMAMSGL